MAVASTDEVVGAADGVVLSVICYPLSVISWFDAVSVKGQKVECSINNKVVASYDRSALVMAGKLKSTDGVYGVRLAHYTDATVTNFKKTKAP